MGASLLRHSLRGLACHSIFPPLVNADMSCTASQTSVLYVAHMAQRHGLKVPARPRSATGMDGGCCLALAVCSATPLTCAAGGGVACRRSYGPLDGPAQFSRSHCAFRPRLSWGAEKTHVSSSRTRTRSTFPSVWGSLSSGSAVLMWRAAVGRRSSVSRSGAVPLTPFSNNHKTILEGKPPTSTDSSTAMTAQGMFFASSSCIATLILATLTVRRAAQGNVLRASRSPDAERAVRPHAGLGRIRLSHLSHGRRP